MRSAGSRTAVARPQRTARTVEDEVSPMPAVRLRLTQAQACHGITVVTADGEIDFDTASFLEGTLATAESRRVVLDLAKVTFMDSSGINAVLRVHNTLTGGDG